MAGSTCREIIHKKRVLPVLSNIGLRYIVIYKRDHSKIFPLNGLSSFRIHSITANTLMSQRATFELVVDYRILYSQSH